MKKIIGCIGAYLAFGIGHLVSIPMAKWDWAFLYRPYTVFMTWSFEIHNWAGLEGLWTKVEDDTKQIDENEN